MGERFSCEVGDFAGGETCVVKVRGEVDLASSTELDVCLRRALDGAPGAIVLDVESMTFIDSSGLRVLVAVSNDARSRAATLTLRNVPPHARRVLDITGLSEWFDGSAPS